MHNSRVHFRRWKDLGSAMEQAIDLLSDTETQANLQTRGYNLDNFEKHTK